MTNHAHHIPLSAVPEREAPIAGCCASHCLRQLVDVQTVIVDMARRAALARRGVVHLSLPIDV
jgi:hypothetical protein